MENKQQTKGKKMSVNKIILVGNLGKDVELRYTPSGDAVASFSMATTERYKKKNGEKVDETTWHNLVVWRQLAEVCAKYLHKGSKIYVEGKVSNRSYDDRDGVKKYISEVIVKEMTMLDKKPEGQPAQQQSPQDNNVGPRESEYNKGNQQQTAPIPWDDADQMPF